MRLREGLAALALLLAAVGTAEAGPADWRTVTLRWRATPGPEATGFAVVVGSTPGLYDRTIAVGVPPAEAGVHAADLSIRASQDRYVAVVAFNAAGASNPSNELRLRAVLLPAPGSTPVVTLGGAGATLLVDGAGNRYRAPAVADAGAGRHLAWCNLDGDAAPDLVLGQGAGGTGEVTAYLDGAGDPVRIATPGSGAARPACGDLDGDGRDEIAIGLDASGDLLRVVDDAWAGFTPLPALALDANGRLPRPAWASGRPGDGAALPAVGDLDGDGRDEIVVGLAAGGGGWLRVLDDARAGLAALDAGPIADGWLATLVTDGATWPALGDADGDGRDEIAIGFGGEAAGSWVRLIDDPIQQPTSDLGGGWLRLLAPGPGVSAAHPAFGDLDDDGVAELVVGFGSTLASVFVLTDVFGTRVPFPTGDDGWIDLADAGATGPLHPAVRRPTAVAELPITWLAGGRIGSLVVGARIDGSLAGVGAGPFESTLPVRLTACRTTGFAFTEWMAGFGPGGDGILRRAFVVDGALAYPFEHAMGPDDYAAANGEIRPACGDVDGDGFDELVAGPGPGGNGRIWIREGVYGSYAPWAGAPDGAVQWTTWGAYLALGGGARPAVGDLDGDGRDEVVVGMDAGGQGWIRVLDDAAAGFAPLMSPGLSAGWLRFTFEPTYLASGGGSNPAVGDLDGDGRDEVVIGMDVGSGGYVALLDDAQAGFAPLVGPLDPVGGFQIPNVGDGSTHPALIDVDDDGYLEIVVGLGAGATDRLYVADDVRFGFGPHPATAAGSGFVFLPAALPAPVVPAPEAR